MLALAVLSTLTFRPMHPYEIASVLRERGKDHDMPIKWGSLYTVVQNLERHGFLAVVDTERQGGRPERTVYAITEAGTEELRDWVRELLSSAEPEFPRFEAGLSVFGALPPDEVETLLRERLAGLEQRVEAARATLAGAAEIPRLFLIEAEYDLAMRDAEIAWLRGLIAEFADGSLPGIEQWREYHRTGAIPPELIELAEKGTERGASTD
jgi:DNA-binding PadR family transcriptional regulator